MNRPGFAFLISDLVGPYGPGGSAAYVGKLKLPDDVGEPVTARRASISFGIRRKADEEWVTGSDVPKRAVRTIESP